MRAAIFTSLAALLLAAAPGGPEDDPASYRVRVAVTPVADAPVQRVALTGAIQAASRSRHLADVRMFDARGRAVPMARVDGPAAVRRDVLRPLPILGAPDALRVTGMSLRLDGSGGARVEGVDGAVTPGGTSVLGVLLDARAVSGAARDLLIDADWPVGQPVTLQVDASADLKNWRPVGERVVYRTPDAVGAEAVPLGSAGVRRDWLRLTWRANTRLLAPVAIRGATLVTRVKDAVTAVDAVLPALADAHSIAFVVPFATPLTTIRIIPRGEDALVPVRLLGRDDREQPWTPIGEGLASRWGAGDIAVGTRTFGILRIEADRRTPGFTTPPLVRFGFAARGLVFLAGSGGPFTLAVGRGATSDTALPLAGVLAQSADPPPLAMLAPVASAPLVLVLANEGLSGRGVVLWAVLLLATALLAGMAWLVWKRSG